MRVTLVVLNLLTSRLVRPEQPANILVMSVTLVVLNPLTSRLVRLEQSENMPSMSVTLVVLRFSIPMMLIRFLHLLNQ